MASIKTITMLVTRDTSLPPATNIVDFTIVASASEVVPYVYTESMISSSELADYCNADYDAKSLLVSPSVLKSTYGTLLNYFLENNQVIFRTAASDIPSIGKYAISVETKTLDYYSLT